MPPEKHHDLDFIIGQLDWEKNVDTHFKDTNYLEPIVDASRSGPGYGSSVSWTISSTLWCGSIMRIFDESMMRSKCSRALSR
jgi:hypothetical protein